jgi:hypothetical protein
VEFSGCDFAVAQPGPVVAYRLTTSNVSAAPPLPRTPRHPLARHKPARAVFKASRAAHRAAVRALSHRPEKVTEVVAAGLLTGEPVRMSVRYLEDGADIRFAEPLSGPVLLGAARTQPVLSWRLAPEPS